MLIALFLTAQWKLVFATVWGFLYGNRFHRALIVSHMSYNIIMLIPMLQVEIRHRNSWDTNFKCPVTPF